MRGRRDAFGDDIDLKIDGYIDALRNGRRQSNKNAYWELYCERQSLEIPSEHPQPFDLKKIFDFAVDLIQGSPANASYKEALIYFLCILDKGAKFNRNYTQDERMYREVSKHWASVCFDQLGMLEKGAAMRKTMRQQPSAHAEKVKVIEEEKTTIYIRTDSCFSDCDDERNDRNSMHSYDSAFMQEITEDDFTEDKNEKILTYINEMNSYLDSTKKNFRLFGPRYDQATAECRTIARYLLHCYHTKNKATNLSHQKLNEIKHPITLTIQESTITLSNEGALVSGEHIEDIESLLLSHFNARKTPASKRQTSASKVFPEKLAPGLQRF